MLESPKELIWSKWRHGYREAGERPPAKHITSMDVTSREVVLGSEGLEQERVRVVVQISKNEYEVCYVTLSELEVQKHVDSQSRMDSPGLYWSDLGEREREGVLDGWSGFENWLKLNRDVARREISLKLIELFEGLRARFQIKRASSAVWHFALVESQILERPEPVYVEVFGILLEMVATLSLYRECEFYRRRGVIGPAGPARTLWEERIGAVSAEARGPAVRGSLIKLGFVNG